MRKVWAVAVRWEGKRIMQIFKLLLLCILIALLIVLETSQRYQLLMSECLID